MRVYWKIIIILFITTSILIRGVNSLDTSVIKKAEEIGKKYDCQPEIRPNVQLFAGIGYSFIDDEMNYAYAKLLNEKGCYNENNEKYVIFSVSTVNFPSDGIPSGNGKDAEELWLEYWDYNAKRFLELGYKIVIHPHPFIIKNKETNAGYPPGLRPLVKNDLNLKPEEIPVVFECRDGRKTVLASIYDPRTLQMGIRFYEGIKNFFSKYPIEKISIVPPSDFGEYGFPFGVNTRWWEGSDSVGDCYLTGDIYAREIIEKDPPSYEQYNGKLIEFMQSLTNEVKKLFPNIKYQIYLGYGDDTNPRDGFSYEEAVAFAVRNGIEIASSHGRGIDHDDIILSKIDKNRPENYPLILEDAGELNEFMKLKTFYHAAKHNVTGMVMYSQFLYDYFYLVNLLYSMGQSGNKQIYPTKGIIFENAEGLGSLKSSYLVSGYIDIPKNYDTINGDGENHIGGWGYFEGYGDKQYYGVYVYAGHLIEKSSYQPDVMWSGGKHPEYMRLVGKTVTTAERCAGCGDTSRFGLLWKPNLATGKAVIRIFMVNGDSKIIAEHPQSPLIVNIRSRFEGNATLQRLSSIPDTGESCDREFKMKGVAKDLMNPGGVLHIIIIDEYRGKILGEGFTDSAGNFDITFKVNKSPGEETQVIVPRAYIYNNGELVALPTNLIQGFLPKLTEKFINTIKNCEWRCVPSIEICYNNIDEDCDNKDECKADINIDKCVNILDLSVVEKNFGLKTTSNNLEGDINGDGLVDIFDLVIIGVNFERGICN